MRRVVAATVGGVLAGAVGCNALTGMDPFCSDDFCSYPEGGVSDGTSIDARGDGGTSHHEGGHPDAKSDVHMTKDAGSDVVQTADVGVDAKPDTGGCDPMQPPKAAACVITDALGVFVAPMANGGSDTAGSGTRKRPYASRPRSGRSAAKHPADNAGTVRVILPAEPPPLTPEAARVLLRILLKAHDQLADTDNPHGGGAE